MPCYDAASILRGMTIAGGSLAGNVSSSASSSSASRRSRVLGAKGVVFMRLLPGQPAICWLAKISAGSAATIAVANTQLVSFSLNAIFRLQLLAFA